MAITYAGHWSPDTCGCVISIEGDNLCPIEFRVHQIRSVQHYEMVRVETIRNTANDPEFKDIPGFEHYEYVETTLERRLVDGPCGADHPTPKIGDRHDGGEFCRHHITSRSGHSAWDGAVQGNPHWSKPDLIKFAIDVGSIIKKHLRLRPSHQLHNEEIKFQYDAAHLVLNVFCGGIESEKKQMLQQRADNKFGVGKVVFL